MKTYLYGWGNNTKRKTMKNRTCQVLARGRMNSIMIKFVDNDQIEIVSRWSISETRNELASQILRALKKEK